MDILENYSLKELNTLALNQRTRYFLPLQNSEDLISALKFAQDKGVPWMVLGGGSNLVLAHDYPGLVLHNKIPGIKILSETEQEVLISVGAGESWHALVQHTLQHHWYGLENLALIPGTVGAAPVQNIGAYGVELSDVFESLEAWDDLKKSFVTLDKKSCEFSYRDSIFKQRPQRYVIVQVVLRLSKKPEVHIQYQSLQEFFLQPEQQAQYGQNVSPEHVFNAVVNIRQSKLPDPVRIPNAGSFFKNPVVADEHYRRLLKSYPALVSYPAGEQKRKLAAGWLIDQAGWKGKRIGDVAVHEHQALVLVNYGNATGAEVLQFADQIRRDIQHHYGVSLEIEPVIV